MVASVPESVIDEYIEEATATGEVASAGAQRAARHYLTEQHKKKVAAEGMPPLPAKTYRCLVIDPPWSMKKIEQDVE